MNRWFERSASLLLLTALAACSGGGSSPATHAPVPAGSAAPVAPSGKEVSATLTFTIPAKKRSAKKTRAYVSPSSLGAIVTATATSSGAVTEVYGYDLSSAGTCVVSESGPTTCTLAIPLYAGGYTVTVALYDQNESGHASAPAGNLLSTDTESETIVVGENNTLSTFTLHAQVDYFDGSSVDTDADTFGAVGGTAATNAGTYSFIAEDADKNEVDFLGNATTYANAPLAATAADLGDTTGCASACFSATNDVGTTPAAGATISQLSDEGFTLHYTGGGGPGSGVRNSTNGAQPTGQRPYAGQLTAVAAKASDFASVVPLYAYPSSLSLGGGTAYVWAAQYAPPSSADQNGTSYAAYFGTPGTTSCSSDGGPAIATIGTGTYYAGYGTVFPITPGATGSCTLTLTDGADPADTVTVPLTVSAGGTVIDVPCQSDTGTPTGDAKRRSASFRRLVSAAGAAPQLVQYATGVQHVVLPQNVTSGDTLVFIAGDIPGGPSQTNDGAVQLTWDRFGAASDDDLFTYTATVPSTGSAGTIAINDACDAAVWVGEFAGTSESAITSANSGTSESATTASIVPNAANGLVLTAADSDADTSAATASAGYTEYFQAGPETSLDVQLKSAPTTDTTDTIGNAFAGVANPDESTIFQIPPSTFSGPPPTVDPAKQLRLDKKLRRAHRAASGEFAK